MDWIEELINNEFSEATDVKAKNEKNKKLLKDDSDFLKRLRAIGEKSKGRKDRNTSVLKELDGLNLNDIGKYVGVHLAQVRGGERWDVADIKTHLENGILISDKDMKKLKEDDSNLSNKEKKDIAKKIADKIIDGESASNSQMIDQVGKDSKRGTKIWAHEFSNKELGEVKKLIIDGVDFAEKINKILKDNDVKDEINIKESFKKDSKEKIINNLLRTLEIELQRVNSKYEFPEEFSKEINDIVNKKKQLVKKSILWPDSNVDLKDMGSLNKYFADITKNRKEADDKIGQYKKKTTSQAEAKAKITEKSFRELINEISKLVRKELSRKGINPKSKEYTTELQGVAKQMLIDDPGLKSFIKKELNTETPEDTLVGELGSINDIK